MVGSSGWNTACMASGRRTAICRPCWHGITCARSSSRRRRNAGIYRDRVGVRSTSVGSAIRHSFIPAPFHYLQLFLRPSFLMMMDLRDLLRMFHVWSLLIMAVGVDPFGEDQPLEGHMLGETIRQVVARPAGLLHRAGAQRAIHARGRNPAGGVPGFPALLHGPAARRLGLFIPARRRRHNGQRAAGRTGASRSEGRSSLGKK